MRKALAIGAVAAALALPAQAQVQPSDAQIAAVVAAVAPLGCAVDSPADAAAVEAATGFAGDLLGAVVMTLVFQGRAEPTEDGQGFIITQGCP